MSQSRPGIRAALIGVAAAAGMLLAACGSSGAAAPQQSSSGAHSSHQGSSGSPAPSPASSTADAPTTPQEQTTGGEPTAGAVDIAGACTALVKLDAIQPPGGPEAPPPAAMKEFGVAVLPLLDEAIAKGDAELGKSLTVLKPVAEAAAQEGSPIPEDDDVMAALAGYHDWAHNKCGYQHVDITAVDYKFEGVPATLKAGPTSILMSNKSDKGEFHVALIVKPKDPSVTTVDALLAIPMKDLEGAVEMVGSAAAPPGASSGTLLDLRPGHYFMVCPVPVGGDEQGEDIHMLHGMAVAFDVS